MTSTYEKMQDSAKLMTVAEVAAKLDLSIWSVYRKIEDGTIPAIKLGSGKRSPVRVDPRELDEWLREDG